MSDQTNRRRFLGSLGAVAVTLGVAGCSSDEDNGGDGDDGDTTSENGGINDTEEAEQSNESGGEDKNEDEVEEEDGTGGGPLTTEWGMSYPDDTGSYVGGLALGEQRAYVSAAEGASVLAYDLASGELLWRWEEYVDRPAPALTYHDAVGPIAVMRARENLTGNAYALDAASGELQWEYQDPDVGWNATKATDKYVVTGSGTGMVVLNPTDGSEVTKFTGKAVAVDDDTVNFYHDAVGIGQSELYGVDTRDNKIFGYDMETGEQTWQASDLQVDNFSDMSMTAVNGTVVVIDGKSVFGIDPQAGEVKFQLDAQTYVESLVGSDSQAFFINETDPSTALRSLDVTQGTIGWEQTEIQAIPPEPALADGRLLVSLRDRVALLDAASGDIIQPEFDPLSQLDTKSELRSIGFLEARGDTAVVAGIQEGIYGLSVQN